MVRKAFQSSTATKPVDIDAEECGQDVDNANMGISGLWHSRTGLSTGI